MINAVNKPTTWWASLGLVALLFLAASQAAWAAGSTLVGTYNGNSASTVIKVFQAEQAWQGKDNAVATEYEDWCGRNVPYIFQLANDFWNDANVPALTWQPENINCKTDVSDPDHQIAAGAYDSYINNFISNLKTFLAGPDGVLGTADDRRMYIRFGHEMNGNWYAWSPAYSGSTDKPQDYVNAWIHVVTMIRNAGVDADHVQFVWCVNNNDVGAYPAEQFWPGAAYVNWVGIDGYNWGASQSWSTWQTAAQVFGNMAGRVQALTTLPLAIPEVGSVSSTTSGVSVSAKAAWLTDFFSNFIPSYNVKMVCWFNTDQSQGKDWAVFGGSRGDATFSYGNASYNVYTEYKTGVDASTILGSDPANPRLLTSAQFAGSI